MKEKSFPKPPCFVWENSATLWAYCNCWDQLFITYGLLVKSLAVHNEFPRNAVVIPRALLPTVLQGLHISPSGGHMGITHTLHHAREHFFWPKMQETIDTFIQNCQECSHIKDKSFYGKAPLRPIQVSEPFVFWALDYMGPLQETAKGNKNILVVIDHFTKWCKTFPTKDKKAQTVAKILVSTLFSRFGTPTVLHPHQGRNFDSLLMHEVHNVMGHKKTRTTTYHPPCDG